MSASSANGLLALCGSFIALSSATVGLRFFGRRHQGVSLGLDDWTALFGVVTFIGACAMAIELVVMKTNGYGTPTKAEAARNLKPSFGVTIAYDFLIMNTLTCAKLSALFLYRRLFGVPPHGRFNTVILFTVAVIIAWCITFDVLSCLQCRSHFSAFTDGTFKKYCDLNPVWARGLAFSDFFLDLWVFLLPIPAVWGLHMTTTKRLSVIGVFLLALVGIGASIARIVIFYTAKAPGAKTLYIGVLEAGMIITVVNLPSIWYICTSTIPTQLRRSLAGRSSMYIAREVKGSHSDGSSHDTPYTGSIHEKMPVVTISSPGHPTDVPSAPPLPAMAHGLRHDLESRSFETHATRGTTTRNHGQRRSGQDFPANVIHVQSEVEVRRDQPRA